MRRLFRYLSRLCHRIRGRLFGYREVPFVVSSSELAELDTRIPVEHFEPAFAAIREQIDRELVRKYVAANHGNGQR